jgi:hypothetical protein
MWISSHWLQTIKNNAIPPQSGSLPLMVQICEVCVLLLYPLPLGGRGEGEGARFTKEQNDLDHHHPPPDGAARYARAP